MRVKNARKPSIYRLRHSIAMVKEINAAKRLILKQFSLGIPARYSIDIKAGGEILMHISGSRYNSLDFSRYLPI
jgi:hypothetical protein